MISFVGVAIVTVSLHINRKPKKDTREQIMDTIRNLSIEPVILLSLLIKQWVKHQP